MPRMHKLRVSFTVFCAVLFLIGADGPLSMAGTMGPTADEFEAESG